MKLSVVCLLFTFLSFAAYANQANKEEQAYLEAMIRLYQEHPEDTANIIALLSKGLSEHPDSLPLLQFRANLYCSRGMLSECRADTRRTLRLKSNFIEARMMLCMLDEFEGVGSPLYEACYRKVAAMYAELQPASSDQEIANKFNYIFALLMARHPDAEKETTAFLSKMASNPQAHIYHEVLDNFNREHALREVFGQ
jgi:hypothetical protein